MRARLALHVSGVEYEQREVELRNKPLHMLELSPKGTVPVLWLPGEDGRVLDESLDIMKWTLTNNDPLNWLAQTESSKSQTLKLIKTNDGEFKRLLDRYKYPNRFDLPNGDSQRDLAVMILSELNDLLSRQAFLGGAYFSFVDAAIAPFVRQFARTDMEWFKSQPIGYLINWLNYFEDSDIFQTIMKKI